MKQGTVKVKCKCYHEQQDKMYGQGVRVANTTSKGDAQYVDARCTVCGHIHRVNRDQVK